MLNRSVKNVDTFYPRCIASAELLLGAAERDPNRLPDVDRTLAITMMEPVFKKILISIA